MGRRRDDDDDILADVSGKPVVVVFNNTMTPSQWGKTTLELTPTRIVDRTKFLVTERTTELLLSEVQAVEYMATGNPVFLALGFPLLFAFGLGLIFLILYFFFKYRFIVIRSTSTVLAVAIKGRVDPYLDFLQAVMEEAERVKAKSSGGGKGISSSVVEAAQSPAPRSEPPASVRDRVAASGSAGGAVRCPECKAEYRLPAGSAGKKFRCQKCQAVIET